jgi:hypothetical protein
MGFPNLLEIKGGIKDLKKHVFFEELQLCPTLSYQLGQGLKM